MLNPQILGPAVMYDAGRRHVILVGVLSITSADDCNVEIGSDKYNKLYMLYTSVYEFRDWIESPGYCITYL